MKNKRQMRIVEIISSEEIGTQEELAQRLADMGDSVTQATVSRDIRELNLVKVPGSGGKAKYAVSGARSMVSGRLSKMFVEAVTSIDHSGNMVVIHTISGSANAAAELVDTLDWPEILACIAGDNTIIVIVRENYTAAGLAEKFTQLIR